MYKNNLIKNKSLIFLEKQTNGNCQKNFKRDVPSFKESSTATNSRTVCTHLFGIY